MSDRLAAGVIRGVGRAPLPPLAVTLARDGDKPQSGAEVERRLPDVMVGQCSTDCGRCGERFARR